MSEFVDAFRRPWLKRLVACLFGGFVLALMVGNQEGTINGDFGIAFREAVLRQRIVVFLAIGFVIFLLMTYWRYAKPYLTAPGVAPLGLGILFIVASQTVLNWYDPLVGSKGNGKFSAVRSAVDASSGLSPVTAPFFDWLAWALLGLGIVVCGAAIITRTRWMGYLTGLIGLAGAVIAYLAHKDVVDIGGGIDHSFGMFADVIGFLLIAGAGVTAVYSRTQTADTRGFVQRVLDWRPGLVFAVIGVILGLFAFVSDGWFAPLNLNLSMSAAHRDFQGTGLTQIASQYLAWLGWLLFAAAAVLSLVATYLRNRLLGWAALVVSVVGVVLTFFTLKSMTERGAAVAAQYGPSWKNLGAGGFVACMGFGFFVAAALPLVVRRRAQAGSADLPVTRATRQISGSSAGISALVVGGVLALFYAPTLPVTWQNVLVSQIGVAMLLAVGLNVVVGWAGLLDLGYIAFYEIGAYTSAYLVGALPVKPPSWLHMTPLLTIPFAIAACLIAGVLLGAPTLRLRGDYLAIVTLGFGEIIQIMAINNPGNFTGGPQGPTIPHPVLKIGGLHITWGQDNLPYWYLLLLMLVVVVILFYRLEGSRLGRAWAAIREDEVAAQATGVNTTRVKLLAFAIGASTSALAGSFFATQVGYFDPSLFTLQASILIVAYVVFGGMGSLPGAMAGAAVLTWLPQFLKDQVPQNDRQMWIGALLLLMMIFRPAGLIPAKRRKAELEGLEHAPTSEVQAVPAAEGM